MTIPAELTSLPYRLHVLQRADASQAIGPEYVTGYLTPPGVDDDGYSPRWLEAELESFRSALPVGWTAVWLATDIGDTRIVVRPTVKASGDLEPGWEERAVARARREGVLPSDCTAVQVER